LEYLTAYKANRILNLQPWHCYHDPNGKNKQANKNKTISSDTVTLTLCLISSVAGLKVLGGLSYSIIALGDRTTDTRHSARYVSLHAHFTPQLDPHLTL